MTPLQKRRIEQLIDKGQYEQARRLLRKLPHDKEARDMLSDMAITYPVTRGEKAIKSINKVGLYVMLAILSLIAIAFAIGIVQLIQAQAR